MKPSIRIGVAVLLHGITTFLIILAVGTAWAAVYVFGLGKWDPKFGPWGMMQLYFFIAAALAGIQSVVFLICHSLWAAINHGFAWPIALFSTLLLAVMNIILPILSPLGETVTFLCLVFFPIIASAVMVTQQIRKRSSNHGLESTGAPPAAGTPETHP